MAPGARPGNSVAPIRSRWPSRFMARICWLWNWFRCSCWRDLWERITWVSTPREKGNLSMQANLSMNALLLAAILFALGLAGLLARRNVIFTLMSIEVMLNAAGLAFVAAGSRWAQPDGQVIFLFILAMAAAEVSVGLALVLRLYHLYKSLDVDTSSLLRG